MSAYIQFFIRHEDTFLPIGVFSRNNVIYQVFDDVAPWGKLRPISEMHLNDVDNIIKSLIKEGEDALAREAEEEKLIASFNNSVEEKLMALADRDEFVKEVKDDIKNAEAAQRYVWTLRDIFESIEYTDFNKKPYIYVGIEVNGTVDELI